MKSAAGAEQRQSSLALKFDPGGRRTPGFGLSAVIVGVLVVLGAVPLNWAAQAFDLDPFLGYSRAQAAARCRALD